MLLGSGVVSVTCCWCSTSHRRIPTSPTQRRSIPAQRAKPGPVVAGCASEAADSVPRVTHNPANDWYRPTTKNYTCGATAHPKPPKALLKAMAAYTHMSVEDAGHVVERIRHLAVCLREDERITLLRLLPGKHQIRRPTEVELEAIAEGDPSPSHLPKP